MVKNLVLFILNADGSYKVAPIGTIRANSRNSCLIGVLAPTPHDNIVQVGYSIQDSVDIQVSQFLDLSSQKGADIISPQASYYDEVKEWHYWESNITPQALSYVSKHRGGKTGISITISEREIPKEATNYKGYFGYQPLPSSANNGDFYECDKNDTVAFGYTFAKGDIAYYLNGWQQSRLYAVMTTSTEPIPVAPNISVGAVDDVDDLTPVYERLGEQQAQINNNTSSVGFLRDSVEAIEEDIDNLQEKDDLLQGQINDLSNSTDERFDEVNETLDSVDNILVEHRNDIDTNKDDITSLKTEQTVQNSRLSNVETKATNNQDAITTLNSTKLNKVWSDIASQTEILLTDLVVINRNNTAFKTTIQSMLSKVAIPELFIVVEELPTEPERNRIYLVSDGKGAFNEYIFINDDWENLGSIEVDLTNYYTRAEIDTMLNLYLTGNDFNLFKALNDSKLAQLTTDLATTQTDLTNHKNNQNNPHAVTKAQVGLGNVDNTSDLNKPVSTATQTALGLKANQTDLVAHTGNSGIHVTATDKTNWNGKANQTDLANHINDATKHITASERTSWNERLRFRGDWVGGTNYKVNDVVIYDGKGYVTIRETSTGTNPESVANRTVGATDRYFTWLSNVVDLVSAQTIKGIKIFTEGVYQQNGKPVFADNGKNEFTPASHPFVTSIEDRWVDPRGGTWGNVVNFASGKNGLMRSQIFFSDTGQQMFFRVGDGSTVDKVWTRVANKPTVTTNPIGRVTVSGNFVNVDWNTYDYLIIEANETLLRVEKFNYINEQEIYKFIITATNQIITASNIYLTSNRVTIYNSVGSFVEHTIYGGKY